PPQTLTLSLHDALPIFKFAYPERTRWKDILAAYAVSVALNGILPANLGTLVFLIMVTGFLAISFVAVLGAYAVEKIFFTAAGARSEEHTSELQSLTNLV